MIDCIALEAPDIDGRVDHVAAAARLARVLADVRAGGRHGVILADQAHRVGVPSLAHQRDIARHVHARRTERHAGHGVLKRGEAPVVLHMVHVVVPEALKAAQDQLRCVASDGAVSRGDDGPRRFFDGVDGHMGRFPSSTCPISAASWPSPMRQGTHLPHDCAWHSCKNVSDISIGHRPGGWTRSCVPCPCRGGRRPSGPCLRF